MSEDCSVAYLVAPQRRGKLGFLLPVTQHNEQWQGGHACSCLRNLLGNKSLQNHWSLFMGTKQCRALRLTLPFPSGAPLCLPCSWPLKAAPPHPDIKVLFILQVSLQCPRPFPAPRMDLVFPSWTLLSLWLRPHLTLITFCLAPWLFMGFEYEYYYHFFLQFCPSIPMHVASQQGNADSLKLKTVFSSCIIWDTVTQPPAELVTSTCVQGGENWVSEPNQPKYWWALVKKLIKCIFRPTTVLGGHRSFLQILKTKQSAVPKG